MALFQQHCSQNYPGIPGKKNKQPTYKNNNLLSFHEQQICTVQKATWQHPPPSSTLPSSRLSLHCKPLLCHCCRMGPHSRTCSLKGYRDLSSNRHQHHLKKQTNLTPVEEHTSNRKLQLQKEEPLKPVRGQQ